MGPHNKFDQDYFVLLAECSLSWNFGILLKFQHKLTPQSHGNLEHKMKLHYICCSMIPFIEEEESKYHMTHFIFFSLLPKICKYLEYIKCSN